MKREDNRKTVNYNSDEKNGQHFSRVNQKKNDHCMSASSCCFATTEKAVNVTRDGHCAGRDC